MQTIDDPCAEPASEYAGLPDVTRWIESRLDIELWDKYTYQLKTQTATANEQAIEDVVEATLRAAAVDSGAIEGLYTITPGVTKAVALQEYNWQDDLSKGGSSAGALFEAQLLAYRLAGALAKSDTGITEAHVRQLHIEIRRPEEGVGSSELGIYKTVDNCTSLADGSVHRYARPYDVVPHLRELLTKIRTEPLASAHPVLRASYLHYGLVAIHPFLDGNGRVARAVASALLQEAVGLPLIIYADQRGKYIRALEFADSGESGPFVAFLFDRCLDSIRFASDRLGAVQAPTLEDFDRLFAAHAGLTFQQVTDLATGLLNSCQAEMTRLTQGHTASGRVGFSIGGQLRGGVAQVFGQRFRGTNEDATQSLIFQWMTQAPANASISVPLGILIAKNVEDRFPLVIADWDDPSDRLEIRLDDIYPEETTDLKMRRSSWLERKTSGALERLLRAAQLVRQQKGL